MGFDDYNIKEIPVTIGALPKDLDGEYCNGGFNYESVLWICFTVNQCARYMFNPKRSYKKDIQHIGWYIKGTWCTRGIIMKSTNNLQIDYFVGAAFSGLWIYENELDLTSVNIKSRFLFMWREYLISWSSRLQSEIALSIVDAEYIAKSMPMNDLI